MSSFEYLLALVSILVGLAVADLAYSLHRLLRARRRVRWDWLPLAAALLVMLLILEFWWVFFMLGNSPVFHRYGPFLVLGATLVTMFLLASAALPDEVDPAGLDLRQYYEENLRYLWGLFATFVLLMIAVEALAGPWRAADREVLQRALLNLLFVGLLTSLAVVRARWYHGVTVPVLLVYLLWQWSGLQLA
jgi:NO-binding membrane sensor protein with MHYT domain